MNRDHDIAVSKVLLVNWSALFCVSCFWR